MNVLVIKLGATGDVVRSTPLLQRLEGNVTWVTAAKNVIFLEGVRENLRCLSWEERNKALDTPYDLAINLEDTMDVALFLKSARCNETFGAYIDSANLLRYTKNSASWFDLSLISAYGKEGADKLKFRNRRTYQEMIFKGLEFCFTGEKYALPEPIETGLLGDVAIAADSGPVWPMKKWAYYAELKDELEAKGLKVNVLPARNSLLEHLGDVRNHRCLVGGDSLLLDLALMLVLPFAPLFYFSNPLVSYAYGIELKIISPRLEEFFYKRGFDRRATTAITVEEVLRGVMSQLQGSGIVPNHSIAK